jgi:DNA-binding XRE family transcriptional regulator
MLVGQLPVQDPEPPGRQVAVNTWVMHEVAHWRALAGLTQAELAGRIGVARETISRCETGRAVHPAMVRGIADALLLAPSVLIGSTDLDAPAIAYRICRKCGARRPEHGFVRDKGPSTCICVSRTGRTRREC